MVVFGEQYRKTPADLLATEDKLAELPPEAMALAVALVPNFTFGATRPVMSE